MKIPLSELGLDCKKKELKDCPFCGNFKELYPTHDWDGFEGSNKWQIFCVNCHYGTMWFDSKEELIELWNTRTAENEKSFLVIDEEKLAIFMSTELFGHMREEWQFLEEHVKDSFRKNTKYLSQNAKSFLSIQKE